ncbi:MAG: tyrosine--tRNA ligase [Parcubacteria group bacterium CG_4_10_14_0_8_um_filter_48_154]|nr:MAG: tyrosine--tRNA ligase [Parcubacteria group bacterium CG2_30_48_51]PIY78363.1 MAG: tyrosine--tRNA ligase [Parcubacteria group bacterium CG_4_10_14_0_8_um_filter_48_154]
MKTNININTSLQKINELLSRGIDEVIDKDNLTRKLKSGKQLRVKLGIDPTSPNIHVGRAVPLFKLRDFQELGHKIVLIIGDFTGVIGDTSDKDSERPMLTEKEVKQNLKSYIQQAEKVIDIEKCEVHYNSEWLSKLDYHQIGKQADVFSLNEFISRENIKKRLDGGRRISLRELLYPLMQGYDSVAIKADVEIGGTDQRFNLLAGRELQRHYKQQPQDIITNPLIEGLDGRKMSSSWGNTINLFDSANEMFGKIMSLQDELIIKYFILTTRVDLSKIEIFKKELEAGGNPRDYKMKLAFEIVRFYHSEDDAQKAQEYFVKTFSKKEIPDDIAEIKPTDYNILTVLLESNLCSTKSEARRLVDQNGVKINEKTVSDLKFIVKSGDIIQKGKRFFVRII